MKLVCYTRNLCVVELTILKAELPVVETYMEQMIPGTAAVEDKLSYAQSTSSAASNANMKTGITVAPTKVDEIREVGINK